MPKVSVLSEEAGAIIEQLWFLSPVTYASPERKRKDGKAAFVHPKCIPVSILV